MNCMNCGARLYMKDREYCPHCGFNIRIQRKIDYLSKYYYNQGYEKATIRDLSGAISCLKMSLSYDKNNIDARNLLGLVYFETGEVVAALSEWVISKNLQPGKNLASEYIARLQANAGKLEAINVTIKKYNNALQLCRDGHEDMAAIQLRRILTQNSKLIKAYHLLALIAMKNQEWNKARRILKKAARIDKTNTTTLRFLKEVDEQTGTTTRLDARSRGVFGGADPSQRLSLDVEKTVQTVAMRARSRLPVLLWFILGIAAGSAAVWTMGIPAIRENIYRQANQQIVRYSEALASQGAELSRAQDQASEYGSTAESAQLEIEVEKARNESYRRLLAAFRYLSDGDADSAALEIQNVYMTLLDDSVRSIYNTIVTRTGVRGIEETFVPSSN